MISDQGASGCLVRCAKPSSLKRVPALRVTTVFGHFYHNKKDSHKLRVLFVCGISLVYVILCEETVGSAFLLLPVRGGDHYEHVRVIVTNDRVRLFDRPRETLIKSKSLKSYEILRNTSSKKSSNSSLFEDFFSSSCIKFLE